MSGLGHTEQPGAEGQRVPELAVVALLAEIGSVLLAEVTLDLVALLVAAEVVIQDPVRMALTILMTAEQVVLHSTLRAKLVLISSNVAIHVSADLDEEGLLQHVVLCLMIGGNFSC